MPSAQLTNERIHRMADATEYVPPKVWTWNKESGGRFANINRPTAGAQKEKELPVGKHPLQLYSLATPNGVKVTTMLEELLAAGHKAEYDAWLININDGSQFGSGFVAVNPNSKIPALMDRSGPKPIRVFESGAILVHLAEKFGGAFLPKEPAKRAECLSWLFWQMGSAPYLGGGFGHFYAYAPMKIEYAIDRFAMEVKRQLDVLDRQLAANEYIAGDEYTIADMAIWPWYGALAKGLLYGGGEFLSVHEYKNVNRWTDMIGARPGAQRGRMVNRVWGDPETQLPERHDASDFDKLKVKAAE
jgi:GST-like protein